MKIFQCGHCGHPLFFENNKCEKCGRICGYRDLDRQMLVFDPAAPSLTVEAGGPEYKYCRNKQYEVCNWLLEQGDPHDYCTACQLNRTVPDISENENFEAWRNLEVAKHRLVYQLQKIGLALPSKLSREDGLCFDFVSRQEDPNLMTGHANGVITILLSEADPVLREKMRKQLLEPYRTLIGHLRHEVGHYFWDRLVLPDPEVLQAFRALFGDEQEDYAEALDRYYKEHGQKISAGAYISNYASAHPWEDWAETWAHYLHIMDMVETAYYFGLKVDPQTGHREMEAEVAVDPYTLASFDPVIQTCVPLSFAVNSINRSMGLPDVYPFVVTSPVVEKMRFIHRLLQPGT